MSVAFTSIAGRARVKDEKVFFRLELNPKLLNFDTQLS